MDENENNWGPHLSPEVSSLDHFIGSFDAPIALVEYGDYQCPYCRAASGVVERLRQRFGSSLQYVFRNFPLSEAHPDATLAAEASEAAGAQGRFWEMHDLLYRNQEDLEREGLIEYARKLDLDLERFRNDLDQGRFRSKVEEDLASGLRSGVSGTPTFFINGDRYDGPVEVLEQALLKAQGERAAS